MNHEDSDCCTAHHIGRRATLKSAFGIAALGIVGGIFPGAAEAAALTKAQRDAMTPDDVLEMIKKGNDRFRLGKMHTHDYLAQKRASVNGQYPAAVILSCIDSRAPAEVILDAGIGDTFNARVAGNVANDDLLGSLEYACAVAGSKVVLVMGHTSCGAIKGAIDGAELGNLTELLAKIKPAVESTAYTGDRSSKNNEFVDAVATTNVQLTISEIRRRSSVLAQLEKDGKIKIVGAMYHLVGGKVVFLS
ncbi:carbonic anhydrase family protein [Burkholderia vietnamiensis]|uniref:Carbonic anhydrase family protein n=1 Tax=Burkholderia vietnamiensis TaxID=60552 RepID=A0AAW7T3E7_BURVI|nr:MULTISPECIES: carbonic anhydrase family protein [Burkholderia]KVE08711.1 carbonic anhydrase [Burkholderia vietnamiensis]KVF65379.1 carbonic anhydrase [Burkholderia vietnamiensis]KVS04529.1 carbonic anhydrase [Burkholderia vietnamiensis]MBR7911390.1 carbonic anhydrase [Burkholderia vietnamiensis]MBR8230016.1 carbonic anhydrase [Burkholderia vietnamiensis]